jgi:DNA-binding NarL/FixJ family response regulator
MKKLTILIVDDHKLIRETLSFILAKDPGFEVIAECGDGQQAIMIARDKRPDIVLLDINMAPTNGFEVLKGIRKHTPTSRVIGISMHSQPAYAKKMLQFGAKGYVTKNSPREEMLSAISEVSKNRVYVCQEVKNIIAEQLLSDKDQAPDINDLSKREMEVLGALTKGFSSRYISTLLQISLKTVEVHRYNILKKLKLKNTVALINYINAHAYEI